MGADRRAEGTLSAAVRVVPDVPSFAVDDGFAYAVPDGATLGVGDIVRVPLSGRRVRGWVIAAETRPRAGRTLRNVIGRSGDLGVFDERILGVLRWAAAYHVAPLATVLAKATPRNVPRAGRTARDSPETPPVRRPGSHESAVWVGPGPWIDRISELAGPVVEDGASVMVVTPTWTEAQIVGEGLSAAFDGRVVMGSSRLPAAEATAAWVEVATRRGRIVVGTRDVAWWRAPRFGAAVIVGEGRRGMKEKATPTVHARELLFRRARVERFPVVVCDIVPTGESLLRLSRVERPAGRCWGLVEVADRRGDGGGLLGPSAVAAVRSAARDGRRVFVFTHRRSSAQRCVACRALRSCPACGASPGPGGLCPRCGSEVGPCRGCGGGRFQPLGAGVARLVRDVERITGRDSVGEAGSDRRIVVGTERDLPGMSTDLAIIVDADGLIMAPHYRAAEDALRLFARVVASAGTGRGRRAVVQTSQPDHPVVEALRRGDPVPLVRDDGTRRAELGFPPGGELLALEVGGGAAGLHDELVEAVGSRAAVLGPAEQGDRLRWLLQGRDLTAAKTVLRGLVGRWREAGARVRVDADPVDL